MPNPYYLVYSGGAHMAGAETMPLDATAATGFLPDLDAIPEAVLARTALFYLCSAGQPARRVRRSRLFPEADRPGPALRFRAGGR